MEVTLKDYIENYLIDDVDYVISLNKRAKVDTTIHGAVVRVYDAALTRTSELRLKISSYEIELIPWKYYDNHPSDTTEISGEEALDLIRRTLKAKYRIEKRDKSRLEILENKED